MTDNVLISTALIASLLALITIPSVVGATQPGEEDDMPLHIARTLDHLTDAADQGREDETNRLTLQLVNELAQGRMASYRAFVEGVRQQETSSQTSPSSNETL